ncbi:LysM peptidoglycan-binding domain-containing protein [Rossellomorea aquimaris]|uniref:LysM peptidoglycan-binding domain-containing protein n=1 Tax=Rossellomorea aquimaris TaxID=189382 RepID=UPI001CD55A58|nr:LysM peptidoglycan-binding domain-containing protein [Rossellomorea aquimaris]MCA1056456.1 LysM peptidoglycan-binding domain-containing protein [Rossellomorea aquimaris]
MIIHVVKSGDTLWSIARQFNVDLSQLSYGNQLKNSNILVIGQSLVIPESHKEYIVQPGDTLNDISKKLNIGLQELIDSNQLTNPSRLYVGQLIVLPYFVHSVKPGDTLYTISYNYKVGLEDILKANNIQNPSLIYPDQKIRIPNDRKSIEVNAYITQTGDGAVGEVRGLGNYFTYLSPFTHAITKDGGITALNDEGLISAAYGTGTDPLLVVTNYSGAKFDSDLAATIFRSESLQATLISNLLKTMERKGYKGVNFDFEYVYPEDRERYNQFLRKVTSTLRPKGYSVSTALAPKIKEDQKGLLYEAHDYKAHGEIVDFVVIMTYEWGWAGGKPWAIAPIPEVRKVLDYAVTEIPRNKILMGVPLYGRDWKIPWQEGTFAKTVSPAAAVDLASKYGVRIQYDNNDQAPFFKYWDESGQQHEVWFEDARSILAKHQTLDQYRLRGISYWVLGSSFPQNWVMQHARYTTVK